MWLCVLYSPFLILHWQLAFASPRSRSSFSCYEQIDAYVQCIVLPATYLYQKIDVSIRLLCVCQVLHVPCFTHYGVPRGPRSRLFGLLRGQNAPKMGSKWAYFTRLCTPNGLG